MNDRQLEELAAVTHAALATLHALAFLYNVRRRNVFDSVMHARGVIYDGRAALIHIRELK